MASSTQTQVDAVKSAVSSISTCSAATTVTLKALLLPEDGSTDRGPSTEARANKPTRPGKAAVAGASKGASKKSSPPDLGELSAKEKGALATQVINATLKALGEAAKPPPPTPSKRQPQGELVKAATRNALRRSSSAPMTPLQPRSINRISTSPVATKTTRNPSNNSINCLSTVECARAAFAALRMLQSSDKIAMPQLQLEAGMSSFVGKLISLGLHEQAVKELRILKGRLDGSAGADTKKRQNTANPDTKAQAQALAEMLDFRAVKPSDPVFSLVVTTQIHALRILSAMKKPTHIEAVLPILREGHRSSPISHLLSLAGGSGADTGKVARQIETLSQILLSLTPSISNKDDGIAADSRLSISPATALELQALGLESRLHWWKLAGHQGDVDRDILSPLLKCLVAYNRRLSNGRSGYAPCLTAFNKVHKHIQAQGLRPSTSSKSPLVATHQFLTSMARESGMLEDALQWATTLRSFLDPSVESPGKCCSVAAQLLALQLKYNPAKYLQTEDLVTQVLAGVQGPLSGDTSELDELLTNVASLRRAIIAVLLGHVKDEKGTVPQLPQQTREPLETFVLQCPRFCLRWLGKPPDPKSSTKDYLRYEQRRQLLSQSIHHTLDSAFLLAKTQLDEQRLAWDLLEAILNDCLALLEYMGEIRTPDDATTYHVKISHFYYMKYNSLRHQSKDPSDPEPLRALRRSIACVRDRSGKEKEKAQLLMKLERMVELCKFSGRVDEALGALQNIRTSLVDDQVLEAVAGEFATRPPQVAWSLDHNADMLSRTLTSIAKMEQVWINWAVDLPEAEQAAVLEHRLWFVLLGGGKKLHCLTLDDPTVDALLRIYNPTRFPIRRLRTLLRLLCSTVGDVDLVSDIRAITADAVQLHEQDNLGDDCSLASYLPHMKALYSSITGLIEGYPDLPSLRQTISVWRSMAGAHETRVGLEGCIDNVPELLTHLQSVADFLRMKGHDELLATVLELSADISRVADGPRPEDFLDSHTNLALEYVNLGQTGQAERVFGLAESFSARHDLVAGDIAAGLHLALTEYLVTIGNPAKANDRLALAKAAFAANPPVQKASKYRKRAVFAYASYLYSLISLEQGDSHHALVYCKESVRILFQEWARIESQFQASADNMQASTDNPALATSVMGRKDASMAPIGPESWKLFRQLTRSISWLSAVYDHLGMFQETLYYAEQVEKLARTTNSGVYLTQCTAWLASVYLKADNQEKSLEWATQAKDLLQAEGQSCRLANLACQIGCVYRGLGDFEAEAEMLGRAESVLAALGLRQAGSAVDDHSQDPTGLESRMAQLEIKEPPVRRTRAAVNTRRKAPTAAAITKSKPRSKAKPTPKSAPTPEVVQVVDVYLGNGRASLLIQNAVSLLSRKEWTQATAVLREAKELARLPADISNGQLTMAACLLGQSLEDMAHDSVFSVVHDSTLSFPTIMGTLGDKAVADRLSLTKHTPPAKTRSAAATHRKDASKEALPQPYTENLREAQECLLEAHAAAVVAGDSSLLHRISTMLQNVTLLLSTISAKSKTPSQAGHATSSTELARNLTWRRERRALIQEKATARPDGTEWPILLPSSDPRRSSLGFSPDLNKFQRDYIEIIPKPWTAVSIALGENKHDLCITKLQAGHSPFVIRLPLERASSRDADNEVSSFQQGRAELLEIIRLINETCHDARDMTVKGAKSAWWADREALDTRLKDLLELIERDWLGGFRGIFSQHQRRPDLLARFQKSFQHVLDKHLPSRRQVRGRRTKAASTPKMTLDQRILELFIGLGDAAADDCDFDDELTDLLYFVVDILQFHGERNAYDEIDFDAMVVETFDALRAYHSIGKGDGDDDEDGAHTILVLDKALHAFPWESLPCMQGLAVSRVPSLACLRRLILEQRAPACASAAPGEEQQTADVRSGHHVSAASGTYILNPSSDLKTTLGTFDGPLAAQLPSPSWARIVSRAPTEAEFERALAESDVLLYFGHGSGAQYIRGRTVRRLDRCRAAALLMGCSSAGLSDAGGYEAQGPVWNYLLAGCPAVVGTLWDVTDKDIDRLAGRALEEWGLLARGTFVEDKKTSGTKGRWKAPGPSAKLPRGGKMSLVEATACAREEACRFRYLTAAAVVVYGIPVYIDR